MIIIYRNTFPINDPAGNNENFEIEIKNRKYQPFNADEKKLIKLQVVRMLDMFFFSYCLGYANEADKDLFFQKLEKLRMQIYCSMCFNLIIPTNARRYPKIRLTNEQINNLDFKYFVELLDIRNDLKTEKCFLLPVKRFKKTAEIIKYTTNNFNIKNADDEAETIEKKEIDVVETFKGYAPHREITKIFTCFTTIKNNGFINVNTTPRPTANGSAVNGWDGFATQTQQTNATPQTTDTPQPTANGSAVNGWDGFATQTQQTNATPQTTDTATATEYEKKTNDLPTRCGNELARPKFEFSDAAQMIIMYALNNIIPHYAQLRKYGKIENPTEYLLRFECDDILKKNNSPRGGKQIEALNNAVIELFTYPLKVTRYVKEKPTAAPSRRDCFFHFVDYYETDENGNVTIIQIAPALLTPNHPVHQAFRQYIPVEIAMPAGYKATANKSDVADVVNELLLHTKPGLLIQWKKLFEDYIFKDSNKQRIKQRILQNFEKRGYVVNKQKNDGFKYNFCKK